LEFKCTEKDRIYLEHERRYDNDEYIICPNYPLDKARLHLQSLVRDQVKVNRVQKLEEDPKQDVAKELSISTHSSCSSRRDGSISNHSYTGSIGSSPRKKRYSSSYSASQRAAIINQARLARSMANLTLSSTGDGNVKQHSVPGVVHVEAGGDYDCAADDDDDHYNDYNRIKDCSSDNKRTTPASPRRKPQRSLITKDSSSVVSSTSMPESHSSSRSRRGHGGSFLQELDRMMTPSPRQLQKKMPASSSNKVAMVMSSLPLSQNSDHGAAAVNEISEQINKLMGPRRKSKLVKNNKDSSQQQVSDVCAFTKDVCDANDNDELDSNNNDHDENLASDLISAMMSPSPRQIKTRLTLPSDSKVAMTMASSSVAEQNTAERDIAENIKKLNSPRRKKRRSPNFESTGKESSDFSTISTLKLLYNNDGQDEKEQNDATSRGNAKPKCSSEHLRSKKMPSSTTPRLASSCSSLDYDNDNEPNHDSARKSTKNEVPSSPFLYLLEKLVEGGYGNNNTNDNGIDRTDKGNKPSSPRTKKKMQLQQKPSSSREECLTTMPELVDYDIDDEHLECGENDSDNMERNDIDCSQHSEPISPSKKSKQRRETPSLSGSKVSSRTTQMESPSNGSRSSRKKPFEKALSMSTLQHIQPATVVKSPVIVKKKDATTVSTPSDASPSISLMDADAHEGRAKHDSKIIPKNDVDSSQYSESSLSKKKNKKLENSHSTARLSSTPTKSPSGPSERKKKRPSLSNSKSIISTGETETEKIARSKSPSPTKKEKPSTGSPALDIARLSPPKSAESPYTSKTIKFCGQKNSSRKSSSSSPSTAVEEKKEASDDDDGAIVAKDKGGQTTTNAAAKPSTTTAMPFSIPLNHIEENSAGDEIVNEARQFLSGLGVNEAAEFEELKIMNQQDSDDDGLCGVVSCSSSLVALSTDGQSKYSCDLHLPLAEDDAFVTEFAAVRYDSEDEDSALPRVRDLVPPPSGPPALPRVRDLEPPSRHRPSALLEINQVGDKEETPTTRILLNKTLSTVFTDECDSSTSMDGDISGNDDHEALHPPSSMSTRIHESDDDDLGRGNIPTNHQTPSLYLGDSEKEESVSEFLASFSSLGGLPLSSDMASSCHAMNVDMSETSENTDHQNHNVMNSDIFRSKQDNDANEYIGDIDNKKVADKDVVMAQSLVRAWLAKRLARRRIESIVGIQSTARRHLAEQQVSVLQRIRQARVVHAATMIQSLVRGIIVREQQSRMEYAATMIQSRVRGSLTRAHLAWMAYAASIIQGLARGVIAREEVAIMIYAATKIEALVRGVIARKLHSPKIQSVACLPSPEMGFSAANENLIAVYDDVDEQDNQSLDLDEAMLIDIHDNDASNDASHYFMYEEHEHQSLRTAGGREQLPSYVMDQEPEKLRPMSEPTDRHLDHDASSSSLVVQTGIIMFHRQVWHLVRRVWTGNKLLTRLMLKRTRILFPMEVVS
jgi:IQ calmodulin-binding motif